MDLAYERGEISASDLEEALPGAPSNSAVRSFLRTLEAKGFLVHSNMAGKFLYRPAKQRDEVARGEASRLVTTFFGGSVSGVLATLLSEKELQVSDAELEDMRRMIETAKERGK